jgi:hypothetical protein
MNLDNFKSPLDGGSLVGIRIRIPSGEYLRVCHGTGLMGSAFLAEILRLRLAAVGENKCPVALLGQFSHCVGIVSLADPDRGVPVIQAVLNQFGFTWPFGAIYLFDPHELIYRPLHTGDSFPFNFEQARSQIMADVAAMNAAARTLNTQTG